MSKHKFSIMYIYNYNRNTGSFLLLDNLHQILNHRIKGKRQLLDENKFNFFYLSVTCIVFNSAVDYSRILLNQFESLTFFEQVLELSVGLTFYLLIKGTSSYDKLIVIHFSRLIRF